MPRRSLAQERLLQRLHHPARFGTSQGTDGDDLTREVISFGCTDSFAWAGAGVFGLGRRRMSRTVVAETNTPSVYSVMAIRRRPHIGFRAKTSQMSSAISRGVLLTGSQDSRRPPSLPSWKALSQR
jgi:hypothetical protein